MKEKECVYVVCVRVGVKKVKKERTQRRKKKKNAVLSPRYLAGLTLCLRLEGHIPTHTRLLFACGLLACLFVCLSEGQKKAQGAEN